MTGSIRRKRDRIHCPDAGAGSDVDDILKDSNQLGFPIYGAQVKDEGGKGFTCGFGPIGARKSLLSRSKLSM
jgi:hypothetical protein